jgi:hypothetical protein
MVQIYNEPEVILLLRVKYTTSRKHIVKDNRGYPVDLALLQAKKRIDLDNNINRWLKYYS